MLLKFKYQRTITQIGLGPQAVNMCQHRIFTDISFRVFNAESFNRGSYVVAILDICDPSIYMISNKIMVLIFTIFLLSVSSYDNIHL